MAVFWSQEVLAKKLIDNPNEFNSLLIEYQQQLEKYTQIYKMNDMALLCRTAALKKEEVANDPELLNKFKGNSNEIGKYWTTAKGLDAANCTNGVPNMIFRLTEQIRFMDELLQKQAGGKKKPLKNCTCQELKDRCRARGLKVSGTKMELIQRLQRGKK